MDYGDQENMAIIALKTEPRSCVTHKMTYGHHQALPALSAHYITTVLRSTLHSKKGHRKLHIYYHPLSESKWRYQQHQHQ